LQRLWCPPKSDSMEHVPRKRGFEYDYPDVLSAYPDVLSTESISADKPGCRW
jgi:hypothetical protein